MKKTGGGCPAASATKRLVSQFAYGSQHPPTQVYRWRARRGRAGRRTWTWRATRSSSPSPRCACAFVRLCVCALVRLCAWGGQVGGYGSVRTTKSGTAYGQPAGPPIDRSILARVHFVLKPSPPLSSTTPPPTTTQGGGPARQGGGLGDRPGGVRPLRGGGRRHAGAGQLRRLLRRGPPPHLP